MSQLSRLNKQIESFITRYYLNELIKGSILFFAILVSAFLLIIVLEYFGRFDSAVRAVFLFGFTAAFLGLLLKYVAIPIARVTKLTRRMDYTLAAGIIGKSIPEVNDKLLNTLQLNAISDDGSDLVIAALKEREESLSVFSFDKVVDFGFNKRYLKYLFPPLFIVLFLGIWDNAIVFQPASRIIQYEKEFIPPAPYQFEVGFADKVFAGDAFEVNVKLIGKEVPGELFFEMNGKNFRMKKNGSSHFSYIISSVASNFDFKIKDNEYHSSLYHIEVLNNPQLNGFELEVNYPSYTGLKNKTIKNAGDVKVPNGSTLKWRLKTQHASSVAMQVADTLINFEQADNGAHVYQQSVKDDFNYQFILESRDKVDSLGVFYNVVVERDEHPVIGSDRVVDSLHPSEVFLRGSIRDDYGFTKLNLVVVSGKRDSIIPVDFDKDVLDQQFFYSLDFRNQFPNRKSLEYYFEVYDNDRVLGPKRSVSSRYQYRVLSATEKFDQVGNFNASIKERLDEQLNRANEIDNKFKEFERSLKEKRKLDWNDRNELKELLQDKQSLMEELEKTKDEMKDVLEFSEKELEMDQELLDKQKQLEELFDKVMNDEMKELLEELEKAMDELNKEQLKEQLDKINMDNESLKEELDRNLELFKQLEFEQNFDQMMDRLDELKQKQEELSDDKGDSDELKSKQDSLNQEFDDLMEDMKDLQEQNEELEEPNDLDFEESLQEEIKQEMQESSEQLEQNKKKQAGKNQKSAAQKMEEMQQKMSQSMASSEQQQQQEDMQSLRQIMENLMEISFDQEELLDQLKNTSRDNPLVVSVNKEQKRIKDDFGIVRDSLMALSKRVFQISTTVGREVREIDYNMKEAMENLAERKVPEGANNQQYVMTSANNLALLLDEIMQQMQQQMSENKSGKGNCTKPGSSGKPQMSRMKSMQKQLQKQLEQMKKEMGKDKSGKKPGSQSGQGGQMSQKLARMAAQQSALRDQLRKLADQIGKEGNTSGSDQLKKIADLMDQNQEDIIQKRITQETLKRQQEIEVRMLESEKALREEGEDEKRESKENRKEYDKKDKVLEEYFKKKQSEIELLRKQPVELNPYFKEKNNNYYNKELSE